MSADIALCHDDIALCPLRFWRWPWVLFHKLAHILGVTSAFCTGSVSIHRQHDKSRHSRGQAFDYETRTIAVNKATISRVWERHVQVEDSPRSQDKQVSPHIEAWCRAEIAKELEKDVCRRLLVIRTITCVHPFFQSLAVVTIPLE